MAFTVTSDVAPQLLALAKTLTPSVVTAVLLESGEPMRATAAAYAPRGDDPPHIADNIAILPYATRGKSLPAVRIGPVRGFAYGTPQEFGTIYHPAHPFMRPAFDADHQAALSRIGAGLWRALAGAS